MQSQQRDFGLQALSLDLNDPLVHCIQRSLEDSGIDPDQWALTCDAEEAIWLSFHKRGAPAPPEQGWKLHLTADAACAEPLLARVLPLLLDKAVAFKCTSSLKQLWLLNAGERGDSQVGKFLTIYPTTDEEAVSLAVELDERTRGFSGPCIPSDRPLHPTSLVFYRYGGFTGRLCVQELMGQVWPAIRTPDQRLIPDKRETSYVPPESREDPFLAAGVAVDLPDPPRILAQRYLLLGIISATSRHRVALALDLESESTRVIKDSGTKWQGFLPQEMRRRSLQEATALRTLAGYEHVPTLYEVLEHESDITLILSDIAGTSCSEQRLKELVSGLPSFQRVVTWGRKLAETLLVIHEHGLVFADLKLSNILIGPDERFSVIDFELAVPVGTREPAKTGTRGYMSPQQLAGEPRALADDIYSFGALLYGLVTGVDPSQAPDPSALLTRPLELLRPDIPVALAALITHCLQEQPHARSASFRDLLAQLDALDLTPAALPGADQSASQTEDAHEQAHARSIARQVRQTLCRTASRPTNGTGLTWKTQHPEAHRYPLRDLNIGHAGTALALAGLVAELPDPDAREILLQSTSWLQATPPYRTPPLPGFYIGEAGVGASLLLAGQVLDEPSLITAAIERGRLVATLPHLSPDLMHGSAGRLLFHLLLWDETGEQEHLDAALACGEFLLETAQPRQAGELCWILPEEYQRSATGAYPGYAHGAAGIADALLDLFEATGDARFQLAVQGAARWLERLALPVLADQRGLSWPTTEEQLIPALPWWCHGSTGIGRFFLHASHHTWLPGAMQMAVGAAQTVIQLGKMGGSTLCHGLAGNLEFFLDLYQQTGQLVYLTEARVCGRLLEAFAAWQPDGLVFSSDYPGVYSPDYQVGYAGVAISFLRLSVPEHLPALVGRKGFQVYKTRARGDTSPRDA